jgi:hypothetical protein
MRRQVPPPEAFTWQDAFHIAIGIICIPVGAIILYRTLSIAVALPAILVGGGFIAFGIYRLYTAWTRLRLYRQISGGSLAKSQKEPPMPQAKGAKKL